MASEGGTKAVVAALLANTGIALTKFLAFALTQSSSMLAEAIHSVADSGNQLLLLLGGRKARKGATAEHPFGYGKWWWVPLVVLVVAIVMEGFSFRTAIREANKDRGQLSLVRYVRRAKAPELPVILLEDFAALTGLFFALLGVGLTLLTENPIFDVIGTGLIGLLLVAVAEGIDGVIHMRTRHLGPEELLVAAKIAVTATDSAADVARAIDAAEAAVREVEPAARVIYLEPDLRRASSDRLH
jgi:divalent metal cation (Fe/Co/Zn/Cd) transporter